MATSPPPPPSQGGSPHLRRDLAESFGADPERYDRTRPRYPDAMVDRIVAASPGPDVLDVGCGTGIAARQFQAAGCRVLGVDPDARMAERARGHGVEAIRAKSRRQVARLLDGFTALGAVVRGPSDPARRGGSVGVDFDGAEQATETLIARGYTCDYRPGAGLRLGPHLYTSDDEIDAVLAEVASLRSRRP